MDEADTLVGDREESLDVREKLVDDPAKLVDDPEKLVAAPLNLLGPSTNSWGAACGMLGEGAGLPASAFRLVGALSELPAQRFGPLAFPGEFHALSFNRHANPEESVAAALAYRACRCATLVRKKRTPAAARAAIALACDRKMGSAVANESAAGLLSPSVALVGR